MTARRNDSPVARRMVKISGGTCLHVCESGTRAGPTVILEAGLCATSLNWRPLQQNLSRFARVVAYDRAGLGWSDAARQPRTPTQLTLELRDMLQTAEIAGPYILVGHSFGCFIIQRFAQLFPDEVAGVVLLDPLRAEQWWPLSDEKARELRNGLRITRRAHVLARLGIISAAIKLYRRGLRCLPRGLDAVAGGKKTRALARVTEQVCKLPRELWDLIAAHWSDPKFFRTMIAYLESLPESAREMAEAGPLNYVPVAIVTGEKNEIVTAESIRAIAYDANHIRAEKSGHWVHLDQPELVAGIIADMVEHACADSAGSAIRSLARRF